MIPFVLIAKLINQIVATASNLLQDQIDDINTEINNIDSDISDHLADFNNPHQVTKAQVGLGNVDNTSDINKPVSTAQQNAINAAVLASLTPYFIPITETFYIPLNKQVVTGMDILVDGYIQADGFLVEVT